jgi:uncharacterized RDD family membrane protein YckC
MFCETCGQRIDEGARFCPACGARVTQPTVENPAIDSAHSPDQIDPGTQPVDQASTSFESVATNQSDPSPTEPPGEQSDAFPNGTQSEGKDEAQARPGSTDQRPGAPGGSPVSSPGGRRQPPAWAVAKPVAPSRIRPRTETIREETILPAVHFIGEPVLAQPGTSVEVQDKPTLPIPKTVGFFRSTLAFVYDIIALIIGQVLLLSLGTQSPNPAPFFILAIGLLVLYFPVGFANGRTIGHWATYTEITREDNGAKPGVVRGFVRSVTMVLSFLLLFLGFLWAMQDKRGQTWHDKVAGTIIVDSRGVASETAAV